MATRRTFLQQMALAGAGVSALWAAACGDDDGGGGTDAGGGEGGSTCSPNATIGENHGHSISVPSADVLAGVARSYDIQGTSMHPHTVEVTAAQFAELASGTTVTVTSSTDAAHTHSVVIMCV